MENTNSNTTANNADNIILTEALLFDETLLTERESELIHPNRAGEAVLELPPTTKELVVAVHNGPFHADEIISVLMLEDFVGRDVKVRVVRTRDPEKLEKVDLRLDVGAGLLDHHGERMIKDRPIAACTRVGQLLCQSFETPLIGPRKEVIERGMALVQEVAAADCGLAEPGWITKVVQAFCAEAELQMSEAVYDKGFFEALNTVRRLLTAVGSRNYAEVESGPVADLIIADAQPSARWISFNKEARFAAIKEKLYQEKSKAWYFISPQAEGDWRILCAADPEKEFSGFSSWHLIPEKFRGLRDKDLDRALGLAEGSSIFCHKGGFVAGFTSYVAAKAAATIFVCAVQEEESASRQ